MKRKAFFLLSVLFLCLLSACNSPESYTYKPPPELPVEYISLQIKGTVTDAKNNKPVVGASVYVGVWPPGLLGGVEGSTRTDNAGQYTIKCGSYWGGQGYAAYVSATGYKNQEKFVAKTKEWQTIDFQLEPKTSI